MPSVAYVEHELPRRLRLRIPTRRGNQSFFQEVAQHLRNWPGIESLTLNSRTGSVLIHHRSATADIAALATQHDLFEVRRENSAPPLPGKAAMIGRLPRPPSAVAVGLSGAALYQAARGQYFGNAAESFWTSYHAAKVLRNPWLATALFGVGIYQLARGPLLGSATSMLFHAASARHLARENQPTNAERPGPPPP